MATTELGPCEWFVWDLRRSNLIDRGQLDQLVSDFLRKHAHAEPPALAQYLVDQGVLTTFQAERLLQGKCQGLVLGPYTLMDALGSGSMGTVYKGLSKNDDRWYAIKVLPRRSMWNVRIARRQVRSFEQCNHPAVVPFIDVGTAGGTHYLAWPMVEGESLEKLIERQGRLPAGEAALYATQAAEGLDACHHLGVIHGLLKPSNLMLGDDNQLRILDYGIGSILANSESESLVDTMSTSNSLTSGLDCASPESIIEPANRTPAGDQYSLGCVLYFLLTGGYPFVEETAVEKMMAHQSKQPKPIRDIVPEVPEGLVQVVSRMMSKQPEDRYANLMDVVDALQPYAAASMVRRPVPRPKPEPKAVPRSTHRVTLPASLADTTTPFMEGRPNPVRAAFRGPAAIPAVLDPKGKRVPTTTRRGVIMVGQGQKKNQAIGLTGIFVIAMLAAAVTWLLSMWLFK
jgi:serine/threonine-protein kinase